MSSDALIVLQALFGSIWSLFTSWYIPGTNVTPAAAAFFILLAAFIYRRIKQFLTDSESSGGS